MNRMQALRNGTRASNRAKSIASKLWRCEQGSEMVEFAVAATLLFTLIFGIIDCSRALSTQHFVANVAREATRYAAVRGSTWTGTACASATAFACAATADDVSAYAKTVLPSMIDPTKLTIATLWPGLSASGAPCAAGGSAGGSTSSPNRVGCLVVVKVVYAFSFAAPFLPRMTIAIPSTAEMTIES